VGSRRVVIDIAASPAAVYTDYTDLSRLHERQLDVTGVEGRFDVAGAAFEVRYERPFVVRGTVLAAEPPRHHRIRTSELVGLVRCETSAEFAPVAEGTRATFDFHYRVRGGPIGRLLDDWVGREMERRGNKDAVGLKGHVERRGTDSSGSRRITVAPRAGGGWEVSGRTEHYRTQREATAAARALLSSSGGGELEIRGRDGRRRIQRTTGRAATDESSG
jgi:hypothetical protein